MARPRAASPLASENYFKSAVRLGRQQSPAATEANTPFVLRGSSNRCHRRIHAETPLLSAVPSRTAARLPSCGHDHNRVRDRSAVQWSVKKADKVRPLTCRLCPPVGRVVKENFHNKPTPHSTPRNGRSRSGRSSPTAEFASTGAHRATELLTLAMKWHWLRKRLADSLEIRGWRLTTISPYGCSLA